MALIFYLIKQFKSYVTHLKYVAFSNLYSFTEAFQ